MSLNVTKIINPRSTTMPAVCIAASNFGETFFRVTPSTRIKNNLPPSSAGMGRTLNTASEIDNNPARFKNVKTRSL